MAPPTSSATTRASAARHRPDAPRQLPLAIFAGAVAIGISLFGRDLWLVLLTDGAYAVALLLAAAGWGAWPAAWLGSRARQPAQQICIAIALGLGFLSTTTLVLGVLGALGRVTAAMLLGAGIVAGLARLWDRFSTGHDTSHQPIVEPAVNRDARVTTARDDAAAAATPRSALLIETLLLLTLVAPLVIMLFGAALPPGLIWRDEARGYDALEYHLQAPREYFDNGRITFLPHNVYASFPQQMEMLYLLLMHTAGGPYAGAIPAQLLHALCGVLIVVALAAWSPPGWRRAAVVAAGGSVSWLAYLGCLAYVENGLLFFAAVAGGMLRDELKSGSAAGSTDAPNWRALFTAGLCAGLAAGCKYTAAAFVTLFVAAAWCCATGGTKARVRGLITFGVGCALAFSPWLIRNAVFTGNPVYPFAYSWFGGKAWSIDQAEQWTHGHGAGAGATDAATRIGRAWNELHGDLSASLLILALGALTARRDRTTLMLAVWAALILLGWTALTHVTARFVVPLMVPLGLLLAGESPKARQSGAVWPKLTTNWRIGAVLLVAMAAGTTNTMVLTRMFRRELAAWESSTDVSLALLLGQTDVRRKWDSVNEATPADANLWLVGDAAVFYVDRRMHYTVAFCRDPWLEAARAAPDPATAVRWLRTQNVTHVVFSWTEIARLRATYGFPELVTPAWVDALCTAGLRRLAPSGAATGSAPVEVYEVTD